MSFSDEYDPSDECPIDLELRIDQICDAFESSYQRNERPRIEDYMDATVGEMATQLVELVMVELAYRKKAGETPSYDEYASRFPTFKDALARLSDHFQVHKSADYKPPPAVENLESYEFVGAGSFGSVWKSWDTRLHRFVAVKTPIRPVPTLTDRQLIQREAQIVARAKHRHIVPVHTAGEVNGQLYIVYEFVAGKTLQDWLREGPLSCLPAAEICMKVADAIGHVHQLGIIHRDLKPANILIDEAGEPHVMDFGLAKLVDSASTIGVPGNPLGTFAYMSPEQAAGKSEETDARSDIYSLGAILYEMISGKPPFRGDPREVMQKILFSAPPPLLVKRIGTNRPLELICRKCLEKDKHDRYRTAADLATDLQRYINNQPVAARPVPNHFLFWRWLCRHRRPISLALALVTPLFALLILQGRKKVSTLPPPQAGTRMVRVITEPAGAIVSVVPCDPTTGEPKLMENAALVGSTPDTVEIQPGRYLLHVALPGPEGPRIHQVHRTVPGPNGTWPSRSMAWEQFNILPSGEIVWPSIELPPIQPIFEMAYIEGTNDFVIEGPDGPKTFSVSPFYVATREFTYGDYLKIRPNSDGNKPHRPARRQRPADTMPERYDYAENWAEASGCRLLTDLEFAYLARLAHAAQTKPDKTANPTDNFDEAGGSAFDEIPTNPPIRGILTGYAEWTSTWPSSPLATVSLTNTTPIQNQPELLRIIRGGTIDNGPEDYPREPQTAAISSIYQWHPRVGFRLARTPPPDIQHRKGQ